MLAKARETFRNRGNEMKNITLRSYAKINLSLDVLGLLPNGYHMVEMIMQQVGL